MSTLTGADQNFPVRGFVVYGMARDWEIGRHQCLFSPSFLWKEVPRRGGGWPRETVLPHSGKPTPASLRSSAPSRGRGSNDFEGSTDSIVVIRGQALALPPHMPRTSPLSSSVFHTAGALSAPAGHLPIGKR